MSKSSENNFDLDLILKELGSFGRFQKINYILICIPIALTAMYTLTYVFTAGDLDYRCKIPECDITNNSPLNANFLNFTTPIEGSTFSKCKRYEYDNNVDKNVTNICHSNYFNQMKEIECDEFIYQDDEQTIVSEWGLTCQENEWKISLVGTINNVGQFVALPIIGYISDRYGRRTAFILGIVLSALFGLIRSFSLNYISFIILEFLEPALGSGVYSCGFILGMELVGPSKRVLGSVLINGFYALGEALLGLIAMWARNWRTIMQIAYSPCLIFFIYFWIIPESVRWLVTQGRKSEAAKIIIKAAKTNKVILSEKALSILSDHKENNNKTDKNDIVIIPIASVETLARGENVYEFKDNSEIRDTPVNDGRVDANEKKPNKYLTIFKSPKLLIRVANCSFCWMTNTFVYYGLSLNSVSIAGNKYLNYILICLIEIPSFALVFLLMDRIGRKATLCGSLFVSGIACISYLFVNNDEEIIKLVLFLLGKSAITISFTTLYVYTTELFPTELRHSLLAACSMFGRIGSIIAPQTPLLGKYVESLPMILFGGTAITSGLLILQFPETLNTILPDTIQEAENIGVKRKK